MLKMKDSSTTPPGGWKFYVEETKYTVNAGSEDELNGRVHQHLKANKVVIPKNLRAVIQDQICSKGKTPCKDLSPDRAAKQALIQAQAREAKKCSGCGGGKVV